MIRSNLHDTNDNLFIDNKSTNTCYCHLSNQLILNILFDELKVSKADDGSIVELFR